jgi:hypothetical protein
VTLVILHCEGESWPWLISDHSDLSTGRDYRHPVALTTTREDAERIVRALTYLEDIDAIVKKAREQGGKA